MTKKGVASKVKKLPKKKTYSFYRAIDERDDLKQIGSNILTLFALQLFFGIEDITEVVANDIIVDGSDDEGLDIVYVDRERRLAVITQEYESSAGSRKKSAPAKKARDISSGLSALLGAPIKDVPGPLKSAAEEIKEALEEGAIDEVHIWYVHNLPGSKDIARKMKLVETTAGAFLKKYKVKCFGIEMSADLIENEYKSKSTPILVNDDFSVPVSSFLSTQGTNWKSVVVSVPISWLYEQFNKYKTDLFSANLRDYLGTRKKDKDINKGIQVTAENDSDHFWIFNNGITALVNSFSIKDNILRFSGLSILNGAQTTGAIGNLRKVPSVKGLVQMRLIHCVDEPTVEDIKKYNNRQNKVEAYDFRSIDSNQNRLTKDLEKLGVSYLLRRGGVEDIIKKKTGSISAVVVSQVLAAFQGRPDIAYHQKTNIWEDDSLYGRYFNNQLSGSHIIFSYSLFESVRKRKIALLKKSKKGGLTKDEERELDFFQTRGSVFLLTSAVAECLEVITNQAIPNRFRLCFSSKTSMDEGVNIWTDIIDIVISFSTTLKKGFSSGAIRQTEAADAIREVATMVSAVKKPNSKIFSDFTDKIKQS